MSELPTPITREGKAVLDLFSAAAGGWSLGLHRAGFQTVAACEWIEWRRALYAENNPGVLIYDDVRTLTAERILADLGALPDIVVGSPPCQDISSANTKGEGVEGDRSRLFFEAVRIIGETRPRWFALENSANLRTRGADAVLGALEALGYACWAFVVGGDDIGANHERKRSWLIGCDLDQLADAQEVGRFPRAGDHQSEHPGVDWCLADHDADDGGDASDSDGFGRHEGRGGRGSGFDLSVQEDTQHAAEERCRPRLPGRRVGATDQPEQSPCGDGPDGNGSASAPGGGEVGLCAADRRAAFQHRADWSLDDLACHIRLDDGLPSWVAGARIAVGGPRGTSAASLIVEAFGDSVLPQIPEAIGRAILRTEAALNSLFAPQQREAAGIGGAGKSPCHDGHDVGADRLRGGRMSVSQRMRDGRADDHEAVQCALAALTTPIPQPEARSENA